jgi:hypothetical protein
MYLYVIYSGFTFICDLYSGYTGQIKSNQIYFSHKKKKISHKKKE